MCYAAPGPRCSAHTRATLARAQAVLRDAEAALTSATAPLSQRTSGDSARVRSARAARDDAEMAVWRARSEFEATPDGIRALRSALVSAQAAGGVPGAAPEHHVLWLETRLAAGQARRSEQLAAYRQVTMVRACAPDGSGG